MDGAQAPAPAVEDLKKEMHRHPGYRPSEVKNSSPNLASSLDSRVQQVNVQIKKNQSLLHQRNSLQNGIFGSKLGRFNATCLTALAIIAWVGDVASQFFDEIFGDSSQTHLGAIATSLNFYAVLVSAVSGFAWYRISANQDAQKSSKKSQGSNFKVGKEQQQLQLYNNVLIPLRDFTNEATKISRTFEAINVDEIDPDYNKDDLVRTLRHLCREYRFLPDCYRSHYPKDEVIAYAIEHLPEWHSIYVAYARAAEDYSALGLDDSAHDAAGGFFLGASAQGYLEASMEEGMLDEDRSYLMGDGAEKMLEARHKFERLCGVSVQEFKSRAQRQSIVQDIERAFSGENSVSEV